MFHYRFKIHIFHDTTFIQKLHQFLYITVSARCKLFVDKTLKTVLQADSAVKCSHKL